MRRPFLIAAASLLAFPLMAQPRPDDRGGPPPGAPIERMAQDLGLTDAQKASVQKIFEQQRAKREAARAEFEKSGTRPTPEQRRARMEQDRAEMRKSLAAVLTPEQLDKLEARMRERRGPGGPGGRGEHGRRGDAGDDEGRPEGPPPTP
jgi:Spy/CpxP family protein refolding chaperone